MSFASRAWICAALTLVAHPFAADALLVPGMPDRPVPDRGTLRGLLVDAETGAPVSGAEIRLVLAGTSRVSDGRGRFTFGDTDVLGPDTIEIRHIRYESIRLSLGERDLGPIELEMHLSQRAIPLDGLEVEVAARARARTEARRVADRYEGRLWPREEFEPFELAAESAVDPLRWAPGVTEVQEGHDGSRCVVIRASHGCAAVYVDNNPVPTDHLVTLPTASIDSYVIFGPIEAAFIFGGDVGAAGIVMIFTKR